MKRLAAVFCGMLVSACVCAVALGVIQGRAPKSVHLIKIGDSKQTVRNILGKPVAVTRPFFGILRTETWVYGSRFQFGRMVQPEFPFLFPIRIRLFGIPDPDDIVIDFNSKGKVTAITLPHEKR